MIEVDKVIIDNHLSLDFVAISFTLKDTYEDLSDYEFDILKSNYENDDFVCIAEHLDKFFYVDIDVNLFNLAIKYYYKIVVRNKITQESYKTEAYMLKNKEPDIYANGLINIYKQYLDCAINNEKVILLKRKHCGQLCECYDDIRNRSSSVDCPKCYGTQYVGGFYAPVKMSVSYANSPSISVRYEQTDVGEDTSIIQAWTSNFPLVQNDDIIIDSDNNRYIVSSWQPTYKNGYLIRQVFQLSRIPQASSLYNIEVEVI